MRKVFAKGIILLSALCLLGGRTASEATAGEALVIFKNGGNVTTASLKGGTEAFRAASLAASVGARVSAAYGALSETAGGTFVLLRSETKSTEELVQELLARPDVEAACPNYRVHLARTPDDPRYDELWGLPLINAPGAWNTSTGSSSVYAATIDTGLDYTHEDLAANFDSEHSRNFYSSLAQDDYGDAHGHGSHVGGIIGAVGNNGTGVTGVSWTVKLVALRTFGADRTSELSYTIDAIDYLVGLLKDDTSLNLAAVNMSLVSYLGIEPDKMSTDPEGSVYWRAISALDGLNRVLIVVAAGNNALEVGAPAPSDSPSGVYSKGDYSYPASFQGLNNMIVVAAVDKNGNLASFSNYSSRYVHLAAPGVSILSTVPGGYGTKQGTSMATPYVTGAAALLRAAFPRATTGQVKTALLQGASVSGALSSYTSHGLLNLEGAMSYLAAHIDDSDSDSGGSDSGWTPTTTDSGGGGGGCGTLGAGVLLLAALLPLLRR